MRNIFATLLLSALLLGCPKHPPFAKCQFLLVLALFAVVKIGHAADEWGPYWLTNQLAVSHGRTILAAVRSGDTQARTNVQALIGSQVVFVGGVAPPGGNANLMLSTNVLPVVDMQPQRDVRPHSVAWSAEVLGTLKNVDFEKRVIHIRAKPENWRVRETW